MKPILLFIICLFMGCTTSTPKLKWMDTIKPKSDTASSAPKKIEPHLLSFNGNDCKRNSPYIEKIINKTLSSDTLTIKISSIQDCGTKYKGNFRFIGDTLDFIIKMKGEIVKHKNGRIDTVYISSECYCLYNFTFTIAGIKAMPKHFTINGNNFIKNWGKNK